MIHFTRDYIAAMPVTSCALHKHIMPHVLVGSRPFSIIIDGKEYADYNFLVIGGNVEHRVEQIDQSSLLLLVCPITPLYFGILEKLAGMPFYGDNIAFSLETEPEERDVFDEFIKNILVKAGISSGKSTVTDERINDILHKVENGRYSETSIADIAKEYHLSTSWLEHLFINQTGIRLKNLILMYKFRNAYSMVAQGASITEAAYASGFSDSAHLAATAKKTTGVSISGFYK